tara:strand:- start:194 stop:469 length:276 start_codon:yes stop_codon:yes gene_type:complete
MMAACRVLAALNILLLFSVSHSHAGLFDFMGKGVDALDTDPAIIKLTNDHPIMSTEFVSAQWELFQNPPQNPDFYIVDAWRDARHEVGEDR